MNTTRDLDGLQRRFEEVMRSINYRTDEPHYIAEVAFGADPRIAFLVKYATEVAALGDYGRIRQRAALSSFWIPDAGEDDGVWKRCYGDLPRDPDHYHLLRQERRVLERHVRVKGCSLIIYPSINPNKLGGREAACERLFLLKRFLASRERDPRTKVVVSERALGGNLTISGDWFMAESVTPRAGTGYRQTIFNCHAPTVLHAASDFDREFDELCSKSVSGVPAVVKAIDRIIRQLRRK